MRTVTLEEFLAELRAQGVPRVNLATVCPMCSTVQSMQSLIDAGAGKSMDMVERYFGFSCVGRFTQAGPHSRENAPGRGCDWTLGGLLKLHKLEVITDDGEHHPHFEPATPEQAKRLMEEQVAQPTVA